MTVILGRNRESDFLLPANERKLPAKIPTGQYNRSSLPVTTGEYYRSSNFTFARSMTLLALPPHMEIRTLSNCTLAEITAAFNEAFRDYLIRLQLTEEGMQTKMKSEGIVPELSIGAFEKGQLVGLILHAVDEVDGVQTVYNAGTGVIPGHRGKGLTAAMYRYAIPLLMQNGIQQHVLEVIEGNHTAKKIYEAVGFQPVRNLSAFRSTKVISSSAPVVIKSINTLPVDASFLSMVPAWQNSSASINRDLQSHQLIGAFDNDNLVGFAAYLPSAGRVKQCAVLPSHRRKKIGTALFQHLQQNSATESLLLTNVDDGYAEGTAFLQALKFERILGLHEMRRNE